MQPVNQEPLFRKIDCLQIPVSNIEEGLSFYCHLLGHELVWRTATAAGLRMPDTDTELVIQVERPQMEVNLLVASVDEAVTVITQVGEQSSSRRLIFKLVVALLCKTCGATGW